MTFECAAPAVWVAAARDIAPIAMPDHSFRIVADAASTHGAYSLTEATSPGGAGVPPHAHDGAVECFYVLNGTYRLTVSGTTHRACPGDFVLVPRGAPHQFQVLSADGGRAVVMFAPAGFESVFRWMPSVFALPGEPGPLWSWFNAQQDTRLLHAPSADLTGPAAITVTEPPVARLGAPRLATLADPVATETDLAITLRSDPIAGATWLAGPATTAAWIVDGCYRFDTPAGSITLGEGEFISIENAAMTWAVALTPSSRVLLLHL